MFLFISSSQRKELETACLNRMELNGNQRLQQQQHQL